MLIRLWILWGGAEGPTKGYHLELERPYDRTPVAGERIDLPPTTLGLRHETIESVEWDPKCANLLFHVWREESGGSTAEIAELGFHSGSERVADCEYCKEYITRHGASSL